jgi:hypothetical protein
LPEPSARLLEGRGHCAGCGQFAVVTGGKRCEQRVVAGGDLEAQTPAALQGCNLIGFQFA